MACHPTHFSQPPCAFFKSRRSRVAKSPEQHRSGVENGLWNRRPPSPLALSALTSLFERTELQDPSRGTVQSPLVIRSVAPKPNETRVQREGSRAVSAMVYVVNELCGSTGWHPICQQTFVSINGWTRVQFVLPLTRCWELTTSLCDVVASDR